MSARQGCARIPDAAMGYLRVLSRGASLPVLLYLLDQLGYDEWGDLSMTQISQALGVSRRSVSEAAAILEDLSLVESDVSHTTSRFRVPNPPCGECSLECGKDRSRVVTNGANLPEVVTDEHNLAAANMQGFAPVKTGSCNESAQPLDGESTEALDLGLDLGLDPQGLGLKDLTGRKLSRVQRVFDHWNAKDNTVHHRALTKKREKAIEKAFDLLKSYDDPETEILHAIDNYHTCLSGRQYGWNYKWTLEDFLNRGLERFMDEADPLERELVTNPSFTDTPQRSTGFAAERDDPFTGL